MAVRRPCNVLRELLRAGKPTVGTRVACIWPGMAEVIGYSGAIDYVEFSAEYAPYDLFALENFARGVDLFDHMTSMIKLDQEPRTFMAMRAIGAGIPNILFADIRTVEDAKEAITAVRPEVPGSAGRHGAGARRSVGWGYLMGATSPDYVQWLKDCVVVFMMEKKSTFECLEEILACGPDMVQFGPADFSMSTGLAGQRAHPDVQSAERRLIETALRMGVRPRAEITDSEQAKRYADMGVKDFCLGRDINVYHDYCKKHGEAVLKLMGR